MKKGPSWEHTNLSFSHEIPSLLWNSKFHYRVHKFLPLASLLNHMYLVHILGHYIFQM
jgi:hypothetical protein